MSLSETIYGSFQPSSASIHLIVALLAAVLSALVPSMSRAQAQVGPSVSARSLELPGSAFPKGAHVVRSEPANAQADGISGLHTQPFAALGRQAGSLQTATWHVISGRRHSDTITLHYSASIFSSTARAASAYGDAFASLWEIGESTHLSGAPEPAFRVRERQYTQLDIVFHDSVIEVELRVRYGKTAAKAAQAAALTALRSATAAAVKRVNHVTASVPGTAMQASPSPIYVAPPGTGPVTKSPSLMVLSDAANDPGGFRGSTTAALASKTIPAVSIVPAGGLSRFVRTVHSASSPAWYSSATLYPGAPDAARAFSALKARNGSLGALPLAPLAGTTEMTGWRVGNEIILAYRCDNLITVLGGIGAGLDEAVANATQLVATVPSWLHASGTQIVDATGAPVHLSALNWYGAEQQDFVVGGLDYQSYQSILQQAQSLGYNAIRLPFSDQLVQQNPIVTAHVGLNPELKGLHALTILDRIIAYAGAIGLRVILDNHRSEAGWSSQPSGLWYTDQYPESVFLQDWVTLAGRYASTNAVVGADLRNEPHATATWGDGNQATDWHAAAQRAGNAILGVNRNILIIVEGIQFYGNGPSAWWGANLMGVASAPVVLQFPDGTSARSQLVYSAHDYGPDMCGAGCPWFNSGTTYASLSQVWDQYWGYIASNPNASYAAPVWIGEFGTCNFQQQCVSDTAPGSQGQWFSSLLRYLAERHLGWSYWSINGTQSTGGDRVYGALDWYGLLRQDWSAPTPWLPAALQTIMQDTSTQPPASGTPPS